MRRQPFHSRHRVYQVGLSVGVLVTLSLTVLFPSYSAHAAVAGTLVNLIWIWE